MDDIDAAAADWAVQDVRARLELGSERARGLWQPEEEAHVAAWLALQGEPARAAARATTWVGPEWSASRWPPSVVADLLHAGIVVSVHDPATRRRLARREALVAAAHRAGCAVDGRVEDLRARLAAADADVDGEVLAFARPRLLRDVMRWATLRPWPDPAMEVLERLERVRWPTYVAEGGPVVPARALWDAWADRMDDPGSGSLEATLSLLATPWRPPGRLDVAAAVVRAWTERLTVGPVVDGRSLRALAEVAGREGAAAWLGAAQAFAQASAWAEASDVVRSARLCLRPIDQPALARFTRRWVPRGLPRAPPMPPLRAAPRRDLALPASGDAGRRRWQGLAGASVIERAVVEHLAAHGREAVAGEGALWRSIVGLLLAAPSFDVACGQLPVPRLSGPLDAWTPSFADRRAGALAALRGRVLAGEAEAIVAAAVRRFAGARLTGVRWRLLPEARWSQVVGALPPAALWRMVEGFLSEGRTFAVGLPDLVVLPGPAVRMADAFPATVPEGLVLAEVKGPTDGLRDAQRVRHDHLLEMGLAVEVWYVRATGSRLVPTGGRT